MTKKTFFNILCISLMGILIVPITGTAHRVGGDNPPEEVHRVIEVLFRLDPEEVHNKVTHNFNNYGNPRWFAATPCDGYEGGHSGYDVAHGDDDAPFYSLTKVWTILLYSSSLVARRVFLLLKSVPNILRV